MPAVTVGGGGQGQGAHSLDEWWLDTGDAYRGVQRVLLLGLGPETVAVPIAKVERLVEVEAEAIERSGRERFVLIDDEPLVVLDLGERLGLPAPQDGRSTPLVLAEVRGERVALRAGRLAGQEEIYVKPVPRLLGGARALAGLTVLDWEDCTEEGLAWFEKTLEKVQREGPPPIGLHLLIGDGTKEKMKNVVRNLREERIAIVSAVARKPV